MTLQRGDGVANDIQLLLQIANSQLLLPLQLFHRVNLRVIAATRRNRLRELLHHLLRLEIGGVQHLHFLHNLRVSLLQRFLCLHVHVDVVAQTRRVTADRRLHRLQVEHEGVSLLHHRLQDHVHLLDDDVQLYDAVAHLRLGAAELHHRGVATDLLDLLQTRRQLLGGDVLGRLHVDELAAREGENGVLDVAGR